MPQQQKRPHPHPACHSGVECSRTIFWLSGVSLRGMPAQKTPSFASPAHARFAKVFSFAGVFPAAGTILHSPGCKRCHSVAGVLIFPPGRPALSLASFYQIWPCPCKCPNGHKNGICVCFYPKSAISCRDCPIESPQSLCTPPTKSYKFVSANPCETDTGRINKYYYIGYVRGSFWNFIPFRDSRKRCKTSPSSSLRSMPPLLSGEALAFRDVFQQNQISFIENETSLPRAPLLGELSSECETERLHEVEPMKEVTDEWRKILPSSGATAPARRS